MGDKTTNDEFSNPLDGQKDVPNQNAQTDSEPLETEQGEDEAQNSQVAEMILAMQNENAELKERVLRVTADMENLRKRTQREISDARSYAIAGFARDMLGATDNLVRALDAFPDEARQNADPATNSLVEGIEMTEREMRRLMQKHGIKPIMAEGEKFNPHKHQAVFEVPDPSVPAGIVVQVVQGGFEIGERVLRPAMVGVSKGGPKAAEAAKPSSVKIDPNASQSDEFDADGFDEEMPEIGEHLDREV